MPNPRIEPLKRVLAIEPTDDVAWFGLGKAYMEDGNFDEAAKALQQCITVKPTYSAAYYASPNRSRSWVALTSVEPSAAPASTSPPKRRRDGNEESGDAEGDAAA